MAAPSPGFSSTWPRLPNAGHQLSGRGERPQCFPDQLISASVLSDLGGKKACVFHSGPSERCPLGGVYPN